MLRTSPIRSLSALAFFALLLSCRDEPTGVRPVSISAPTTTSIAPVPGPISRHSPNAGILSANGAVPGARSFSSPPAPNGGAKLLAAAGPSVRLIWQNISTGERSLWLMQSASWDGSAAILPQVPTVWSIAGSGDFNGDGQADILWQNTSTGERSIWFMTGNTFAGAALLPVVPTTWSIAGVGDFNGDNRPDIVWQNTQTGERSIWFMNGAAYSSAALLPQVPTVWSIAAVGDFNGDAKADLVWQNSTTGERSIWFMNGATFNGAALLPTVPTVWKIAGATDFDGDSKPDLAWQNSPSGERSIWFMNGATFSGAALLPTVPVQWSIAGVMSLGTLSDCSPATAIQMALGTVRTLTAAEKASLCVGGGGSASEYVLIPFNSGNVAENTIGLQITGSNTAPIQPGGLASIQIPTPSEPRLVQLPQHPSFEASFRARESKDLSALLSARALVTGKTPGAPGRLIGVPSTPVVGTTVQFNTDLTGG